MQMVKLKKQKTDCVLRILKLGQQVSLGSTAPDEKIEEIAQLAEKYCLVSGSLACPVQYHVEVVE